jgi:hypothetical protein
MFGCKVKISYLKDVKHDYGHPIFYVTERNQMNGFSKEDMFSPIPLIATGCPVG